MANQLYQTREPVRAILAVTLLLTVFASGVARGEPAHAIAMHGEPKYGPDFTHFDYVNPDAPKAGELRLGAEGTFDSFNPYIPRGTPAAGAGAAIESLMTSSADEPFTEYGLIAESIETP